jgi:superfamily II DNA or RNA helicase
MSNVTFYKVDETKVHVKSTDSGALMELSEHFSFFVDGYKFMPAYRNKLWNGKIYLYDSRTHTLPYGLVPDAMGFLQKRGYKVAADNSMRDTFPVDKKELVTCATERDIRFRGQRITPYDYQLDAYSHALSEKRSLVISPTGSGKSLIIYLMMRWYLEEHEDKVLIVVPTTSLVEQMTKDFAEYSSHDSTFNVSEEVHGIYSGKEKIGLEQRVIITTWQSAIKLPKNWFNVYGMTIGDESHLFKAKSLNTIMNNLTRSGYRIGTTGTLDGSLTNEKVLVGNFGPVHKVITTKELIDNETLADLKIKCLVLKYPDELRKIVSKLEYQAEIDAIVSHEGRNRFIVNLAKSLSGNTLVLFNLVQKHGKPLYEKIKAAVGDERKTFYVSGEVDATDRESIREIVEKEKDSIIVASSGTFSTGINIKNLHSIIFAAPNKSQIRVLQSIGRGLRKSDDGRATTVYDISDNFGWKSKKNYTMKHAIERIKIYSREGFDHKVYEIELP